MDEPFFVPDSSPLVRYGNGQSSSWTAGFVRQADGFDQTLHIAAQREIVAFRIRATSLTLLIPSITDCTATISVNSSSPIPACATSLASIDTPFSLYNLPDGTHLVEWDSGELPAGEQVIFWGIEGTRPGAAPGMANVTVDDTHGSNGGVQYGWHGDWATTAGTDANEKDFNRTLSLTSRAGASVTLEGAGSAIYLYGTVGPDHGAASITLNGLVVEARIDLSSPWPLSKQLLWFDTGLDPTRSFSVEMTNLEEKRMTMDFAILTTDSQTLTALVSDGSSASFASTLAGKLVLLLAIPLAACVVFAGVLWCCCRRRYSPRSVRHPDETYVAPDSEKRGSTGIWSGRSGSISIGDEVFVSYNEGLDQRLSDRWHTSPTSSSSPSRSFRSPMGTRDQHILPALLEGQSTSGSPITEEGRAGSWTRPLRSLLASSYSGSTTIDSNRRETNLPPYTPGMNGSYVPDCATASSAALPSVSAEKAAQLRHALDPGSDRRFTLNMSGPSQPIQYASTIAESEVMSVLGAPPSERRDSGMTQWSCLPLAPPQSMPPVMRPTVITDLAWRHASSPASAVSTATPEVNSAMPLLAHSPETRRIKSIGGLSVASDRTEYSAARPDSDVIPFEAFLASKLA